MFSRDTVLEGIKFIDACFIVNMDIYEYDFLHVYIFLGCFKQTYFFVTKTICFRGKYSWVKAKEQRTSKMVFYNYCYVTK